MSKMGVVYTVTKVFKSPRKGCLMYQMKSAGAVLPINVKVEDAETRMTRVETKNLTFIDKGGNRV